MPSLRNDTLDDASFQRLFKECFVSFCAYYQYKFGFSTDIAKEVVHTGFIKLWENRASVAADSAKAYLRKTITNASLDILKHEKVKRQHVLHVVHTNAEEAIDPAIDSIDLKQLSADISKAVADLPEQMRLIFELSRNEGLKYAEISGRLHISVKTVETQMSRALARLRQKLSRYLVFMLLVL